MIVALGGLFMFLIGVVGLIFWIMMLVDCLQRKFENSTEKIVWVVVIIALSLLGAILYWAMVKNKKS
ncbi:MAG: PLDc N-terminal domain-containing protein [Candidatus Omnitrophica bacterium]|nr:PLDc N-terminal domain-containing protein [Candidatus Omnitrophota bacterium]